MEFVRGALLVVLVGVGLVGWRRRSYPGGWPFAFSAQYRAQRQDLLQARRGVRKVRDTASKRVSAARSRVHGAQIAHRRAVRAGERRVSDLRRSERGGLVAQLGELALYDHAVVVSSEEGVREVPLEGLGVRVESGQRTHFLYLTQPDGRVHHTGYRHARRETEEGPLFEEDAVRDFAVRVQNTVAAEGNFRARREDLLARAEAELKETRADTAACEEAREELSRVEEDQRQDPRLKSARAELAAACDRWQTLTGRRPQ